MTIPDPTVALLWGACLSGTVEKMEQAMQKGADPLVKDRNGETCLHMCARSGEVRALERMLEESLHLDSANHNGQTPLHIAVNKSHNGMIRCVLQQQANIDQTSKCSGMAALHLACRDNNDDVVRLLLDNGANCAVKDRINKYADFYTSSQTILSIFDAHFDVCTHGRGRTKGGQHVPDAKAKIPVVVVNDDEELQKSKTKTKSKKETSERSRPEEVTWNHGEVEIYDKMEKYNVDREQATVDLSKQDAAKVQINHTMGFSDEHKQRMQQNVFDRLMGGGRKKKEPKS